MNAQEISALGHRAFEVANAAERALAKLQATPATQYEVLTGALTGDAVDFKSLDRVREELAVAISRGFGETPFTMRNDVTTLASVREYVSHAAALCAPVRGK